MKDWQSSSARSPAINSNASGILSTSQTPCLHRADAEPPKHTHQVQNQMPHPKTSSTSSSSHGVVGVVKYTFFCTMPALSATPSSSLLHGRARSWLHARPRTPSRLRSCGCLCRRCGRGLLGVCYGRQVHEAPLQLLLISAAKGNGNQSPGIHDGWAKSKLTGIYTRVRHAKGMSPLLPVLS